MTPRFLLRFGALSLMAGATSLACAGAKPKSTSAASGKGSAEDHKDGFRFHPRPHMAHPLTAPKPAVHQVPAFVDRSSECFGSPTESKGSTLLDAIGQSGSTRGLRLSAGATAEASAQVRAEISAEASIKAQFRAEGRAQAELGVGPLAAADASTPSVHPASAPERRPTSIYLSNDDTMSLSSAQRVMYAIEEFAPVPPEQVRPHEFLNYFHFETAPLEKDHDFSVLPSFMPQAEGEAGKYTLGLTVAGRPLTQAERRNVNLAYVVDRSGSMSAEGRIDFLRRGLLQSLSQMKNGDIVHVTLFDSNVCQLAENFLVGRDPLEHLAAMVSRIKPESSTDLHAGLTAGYAVADKAYQPSYSNRVLLITDALTNTGTVDQDTIALVGKHYDDRRIRLSGVGVGRDFNDALLDSLTERGKGAYVFLGKGEEVDRLFGVDFVSLVETIAEDVHFILHLPPSLIMNTYYGEEASLAKENVQAIHYFAGSSQMFLLDAQGTAGDDPLKDDVMLTIEYKEPDSGQSRVEEYAFALGASPRSPSLNKAFLASLFARELKKLAERPVPPAYGRSPETWDDPEALQTCLSVRGRLEKLAQPLADDPEVHRVRVLWDTYCRRFKLGGAVRPSPSTTTSSSSAPTSSPGAAAPRSRGMAPPSSSAPAPSAPSTPPPTSASPRRHNEFAPQ